MFVSLPSNKNCSFFNALSLHFLFLCYIINRLNNNLCKCHLWKNDMQISLINIELDYECTFKLYFPWFSFYLQMRFIAHPKVAFFIFPRSEARLMGEESNFTTFAHSRIVCWFKMKSHYLFHCLLPHHIHSVYIISIFDK